MQSVTYRIRSSVIRNGKIGILILGPLFVAFAVGDFIEVATQAEGMWWNGLTGAVLALASLACVRLGVRLFRHGSPDQNHLSLDRDGLVLLLWGDRRGWPWQALPAFRVTEGLLFRRSAIRFAVPDAADWRARLGMRPGIKVSSGKLVVVLLDNYDRPLDEIAEKLNEFREASLSAERR